MPIQTTVQLEGMINGKKQIAVIVRDEGPEIIFQGKTVRELFLLNIPNPGCHDIKDEEIQIHMDVKRECNFGLAGFQYAGNNVQDALEHARKLQAKSDEDLLKEGMPDPEALFASAVKALMERDKETAFALADFFEKTANIVLGRRNGKDTGKMFISAAVKIAGEVMMEK